MTFIEQHETAVNRLGLSGVGARTGTAASAQNMAWDSSSARSSATTRIHWSWN